MYAAANPYQDSPQGIGYVLMCCVVLCCVISSALNSLERADLILNVIMNTALLLTVNIHTNHSSNSGQLCGNNFGATHARVSVVQRHETLINQRFKQ